MNEKLRGLAKRVTTGCTLMEGRDKITTEEIINRFPDGVTVIGADIATSKEDDFPVIIFKEDNTKFYNGGVVLMKIVKKWLENCDGDFETLNNELAEGVAIRITKGRTKNNRPCTKIEVL